MQIMFIKAPNSISGLVGELVGKFTTQPDLHAEKQSILKKRLVGFAVNLVQNLNSVAWNIMTAPSVVGQSSPLVEIPSPASGINSLFIELPRVLAEVHGKHKEMDEFDAWRNAKKSGGPLRMDQQHLHGICASISGDIPDEKYTRLFRCSHT
jgi:hypothetical protein